MQSTIAAYIELGSASSIPLPPTQQPIPLCTNCSYHCPKRHTQKPQEHQEQEHQEQEPHESRKRKPHHKDRPDLPKARRLPNKTQRDHRIPVPNNNRR